jgi:hypothetical protein
MGSTVWDRAQLTKRDVERVWSARHGQRDGIFETAESLGDSGSTRSPVRVCERSLKRQWGKPLRKGLGVQV